MEAIENVGAYRDEGKIPGQRRRQAASVDPISARPERPEQDRCPGQERGCVPGENVRGDREDSGQQEQRRSLGADALANTLDQHGQRCRTNYCQVGEVGQDQRRPGIEAGIGADLIHNERDNTGVVGVFAGIGAKEAEDLSVPQDDIGNVGCDDGCDTGSEERPVTAAHQGEQQDDRIDFCQRGHANQKAGQDARPAPKIYPIVLLLALMRRRDRALLATCIATIIAAYIPYIILGHGQILGFFGNYASEHAHNAGIVSLLMDQITAYSRFNSRATLILTYLADLTVVGATALAVLIQRIRQRISPEAATLLLLAAIFAVSTHIFPWYTTALLPWAAVLLGPLWTRGDGINARGLAAALAWYFAFISISAYVFDSLHHWDIYYILAYYVPLAGLALAAIVGVRATRGSLKDLLRDISTQMNIRKEC